MGHDRRKAGRFLCLLGFALALSGCARTVWVKDGAGQGAFEQAKAACLLEGLYQVPAVIETVQWSDGGYDQVRECHLGVHGKRCETVLRYVPPRSSSYDRNDGIRDQVVRACFYRQGWTEKTIEREGWF